MHEQTFGQYIFLRKIAVGGMGELFLAKRVGPEGFERLVVIKRILPQFCADSRFVAIFLNEARLAAQLRHPHITQIFDLGKLEGTFFICMEYVDGPNLREFIQASAGRGSPLPISAAVWITARVFSALDYAHERAEAKGQPLSVVHQDVSPPNILLSREGEVKLTDFGLARAAIWGQETTMGILRGKFPYMAPEHVAGNPQDKRSDLYAAGVILYELLTGATPFRETGSPLKLLTDIQSQPAPDPRGLRDDIPEELALLLKRLLAKDPDQRPESAREVMNLLESLPAGREFSERELARMVQELAPVSFHEKDQAEATHRAPSPLKHGRAADRGGERPAIRGPLARMFRFARPAFLILLLAILAVGGLWLAKPQILQPFARQGPSAGTAPGSATGLLPGSTRESGPIPGEGQALHLTSDPAGAAVFLDGKELGRSTPLVISGLRPGSACLLRLEKKGYRPWEQRLEVARDGSSPGEVHAVLAPLAASLTVEFRPSPADLTWDGGRKTVSSPFKLEEVDATLPHFLRLAAPGHLTEEQRVALEPGERREIRVRLALLSAVADVSSRPAGAELWVDGKATGRRTPVGSLELPADKPVSLRLEKQGYEPWTLDLAPKPGSREAIDALLKPLTGELRLDSTPWAEVYVDGKPLGRTPLLSGAVPAGEREILLINRDRGLEHREIIRVAAGETARKRFVFNGTLDFTGVSEGTEILIGDRPIGKAPREALTLPVGPYEVTLRDPASRTEERLLVRVVKDRATRVKANAGL